MRVPRSAPELRRLPIAIDRRAISLQEGVRAGLSVAIIIAAAAVIRMPELLEAGLAALLTCLCDPGGPIRRRIPVLLSFTLIGAAVTAGFGLIRNFGPAPAVAAGVLGLFCASFVRIYGQAPQQLGALLSTVIILSLDHAIPDLAHAGVPAALFVAGGLWASLLTMVIWRIYPYRPARRAVAETYRQLSALVLDLLNLARAQTITDAAWDAHARIHRRAVREAIEIARTVVLDTLRARGAASNRAAQSLIRLETADQLFGALIGLSELLEQSGPLQRHAPIRVLRRLRPVLLLLSRVVITDDPDAHRRIRGAIDDIAADTMALAENRPLYAIIRQIVERLRIAQTMSVPANFSPGVDAVGRPIPIWQRISEPLHANLNRKSPALRHAARTAVTAALPLTFTMVWFTPYDHWLTITVVATMQPYFSLTYTRAIERIGGTMAGGLIAAGVGLLCTTPLAIAAAMFPLAIGALAIRSVSFGLFMMALTPLVVLLVETGAPGTSEWTIAFARAALTALGGILAVAANFVLWPSREPELVLGQVKQAIAAHALYADNAFAALLGEAPATRASARGAAGVATNVLEALITRALLEPGRRGRDRLEAAMVVDAALRRCAGRLAALPHDPELTGNISTDALRAWAGWICDSLQRLAAGRIVLRPRPNQPDTDALRRLARQIELMAGAMARLLT